MVSFQRSQRMALYSKSLYRFAEFLHYVPFHYEYGENCPPRVAPRNSVLYPPIASVLSVVTSIFVAYLSFEAGFGSMTVFESLLLAGISNAFLTLNTCQWLFLMPSSRNDMISVINAVLAHRFHNSLHPNAEYEIIHITANVLGLVNPILYFPSLFMISFYLPSTMSSLVRGIDWITMALAPGNPEIYSLSLRIIIIGTCALALGHAIVSTACVGLWAFTYLVTMVQALQKLVESETKRYCPFLQIY